MKKCSRSSIYLLSALFILNGFASIVAADLIIPPCGTGQSPTTTYCRNTTNTTNQRKGYDQIIREKNLKDLYVIAGAIALIVAIISGVALLRISRKNVE